MAVSNFNPAGNIQYAGYSQDRLSDRNRFLIETLLADSGIYYGGYQGAVAAPTPTPTPPTAPAPSPTPSPTPAPAPTPTASQGSTTVNTFVRLALSEVKPGDLITAGFANNLIEAIMALENRVRALEGGGRATPTPTPTPTPTQSDPTPSGCGASLVGGGRTEIGRAAPTIDTVTGETVRGKGVDITVTGDNLGEGVVERVLLGATVIAPKGIKYSRTGFTFTTTATIVKNAKNRITVVTSGGEDSAALSTGKKAPVL